MDINKNPVNRNINGKRAETIVQELFDAFGVAHRKECSTYGLSDYLETVAGLNFRHEIATINKLINEESRPKTIIISGAKVSTKIVVIKKLLEKCDYMILGGGILNTFLKAKGYEIGHSLIEESSLGLARDIPFIKNIYSN